jgi:hypothetical protein
MESGYAALEPGPLWMHFLATALENVKSFYLVTTNDSK